MNAAPFARQPELNFLDLVHEYYLFCGADYLCDNHTLPAPFIIPDRTYRADTKHCPECFCDDQCLHRGDCCPDLYFSLPPLVCTNTTVLNFTGVHTQSINSTGNYHLLVISCPSHAAKNLTDKCVSNLPLQKQMFSPVVTSKGFPVSYRNKHCAQCNGEPVTDVDEWLLGIDCVFFADFNFLSTVQAIIDLAKEKSCRFRYTSPTPELVALCDPNKQMKSLKIGQCNQTGTCADYDETIETACHANYEVPYRLYKNVFCYMCNPPRYMPRDIIDACNTTYLWSPPDVQLEQACISYSLSQYTMPFKNIFCFLCNRINKQTFSYLEAQVNASEIMIRTKLPNSQTIDKELDVNIFYEFKIDFLRIEYLMFLYSFPLGNIHRPSRNITNLAYKHLATFPYANYCHRESLPLQYAFNGGEWCSCEDDCVFDITQGKCCLDKSLDIPLSCINEQGIKTPVPRPTKLHKIQNRVTSTPGDPNQKTKVETDPLYLVIDGCGPRLQNSFMRNRCERDSIDDLVSFLPFDISRFDKVVQYRNFYCFVCRNIIPVHDNITPYFLENLLRSPHYLSWDIWIKCTEILETEHNVLLFDVIRLAEYLGCNVRLGKKDRFPIKCLNGTYTHEPVCNTTGNWPVYDPDVKWACENTTNDAFPEVASHKNYFCYLCNPEIEIVDVIDTCNVTGYWHTYSALLEQACELFPRIYSKDRYKNVFCEQCNIGGHSLPSVIYHSRLEGETGEPHEPGGVVYRNTYRNLFSVASYDDDEQFHDGDLCSNRQIYDAYKVYNHSMLNFQGTFILV